MSGEDFKPNWIKWAQEDFEHACYKMKLNKVQQDMYFHLLMACYFGDDRPYIPDDPEQLWVLAEADSLEHWKQNCQPFLSKKFVEVTRENGDEMLQNPRAMREWEELRKQLVQRQNAGAASVAARVNAKTRTKSRKTTKQKTTTQDTTPPYHRAFTERSTSVQRPLKSDGGMGAKVKSNSKSKAKSGQEIVDEAVTKKRNELWTELQTTYADAGITSAALVKTGLPQVRAFIGTGKYSRQEVLDAWLYWLQNKYAEQLDADVPIKFPLSVFADDVEAQILCIRKEQAEIAEPVTKEELEVIAPA